MSVRLANVISAQLLRVTSRGMLYCKKTLDPAYYNGHTSSIDMVAATTRFNL